MRRFHSYGPLDTESHYYTPREELIEQTYNQLTGENPQKTGHYITTWAPRQTGKTWVMQKAIQKIKQSNQFTCGIFTMERGKKIKTEKSILKLFTEKMTEVFQVKFPNLTEFSQIPHFFTRTYFQAPVGVRGVLGIENPRGSPFNVQHSVHIPNLTIDEVDYLFQWYEKESGQTVEPEVIQKLYDETKRKGCKIFPQFPTGNGKIDIIIEYRNRLYGIGLKSYTDYSGYKNALEQAARYGKQLGLKEISLVLFLETIDQKTRERHEIQYVDEASCVTVIPIFIETGN